MHDSTPMPMMNGEKNAVVMNNNNNTSDSSLSLKPAIERGASWGYRETGLLLTLWGQDMIQRQLTNSKRTRHVWEQITQRIREHGYERTADQVRTRVFNMIAEYRRILKNPTPERKKKCIFFDALNRIYQAKDANTIENVMLNYASEDAFNNGDSADCGSSEHGAGDGELSDSDEKNELFSYVMSPSSHNPLNGSNRHDHYYSYDPIDNVLPAAKRSRSEISELYNSNQMPSNSSSLLVDRAFAHLSKVSDVMREWIDLDRERLAQEMARRREEKEREERREKHLNEMIDKLIGVITKQHKQCNCQQGQPEAQPSGTNDSS